MNREEEEHDPFEKIRNEVRELSRDLGAYHYHHSQLHEDAEKDRGRIKVWLGMIRNDTQDIRHLHYLILVVLCLILWRVW